MDIHTNSEENPDWNQNINSNIVDDNREWGDYESGESGWDFLKDEEPIQMGDKFIMLLESRDKPFLFRATLINDEDKLIELTDKNEKTILVFLNSTGGLIINTDDYKIIEYFKVTEYNYNIDDYKKGIVEIDFEVIVKGEGEKIYSKTMKIDDLLSQLIKSYDCYDNFHKINEIQKITDEFIKMIEEYNKDKTKKLQHWLIPIINNDINDSEDSTISAIYKNIVDTNYIDMIKTESQLYESFNYKEGDGYNTSDYIGNVLRECTFQNVCVGMNGEYSYDERKTKKQLKIPQEVIYKNEIQNELTTILPSDNINIIGYLEESYNKLYYQNRTHIFSRFTLKEQILFAKQWEQFQFLKRIKLRNINLINHLALEDSLRPELNSNFVVHNFNEKLTDQKLTSILKQNAKSIDDFITLLIKDQTINQKLLNYNDIHHSLFKYNIHYQELTKENRKKIDTLLSDNIQEYIDDYRENHKRNFKIIKTRKKILTDTKRVSLAYDYIFSILSETKKNELLKEFIDKFTRSSDKPTENINSLYNKYTNQKILCKHYLYSVEINNSNNVFKTMKTIFGRHPEDGKIYCKYCNEFLCDDDFSTLEGFSDDKPIQNNEVLDKSKIDDIRKEKIDSKPELVSLITMISTTIGVTLTDLDIYEILLSYDNLNHNVLADIRYKMTGVSNTDIHPKINKLLEDIRKKEKKEKDKKKKEKLKKQKSKIMNEFQKWIKDTNKLLLITSLISLFIQTGVPVYKTKRNINLRVIDPINGSVNTPGVSFMVAKIKLLSKKYSEDFLFKNCEELINDKDTETINEQFSRVLEFINSPNFPIIIDKINKYNNFIESEKKQFIRNEWTTYKPLSDSKLVLSINKYLSDINPNHLRKLYRGPLIENIAIVRSINDVDNLYKILNVSSIQILQNTAFKKLFRYIISCYGIHTNNILINLTAGSFIDTSDKKEEVLEIFKENGWSESTRSFPKLDFKLLRTNLIPKIFDLYTNEKFEIETCFDDKEICNTYIHTSVNNYDLPLLNTKPKRILGYHPANVYSKLPYADMNKDHIDKLFSKYKLDEYDNIVTITESIAYLDKYRVKNVPLEIELDEIKEGQNLTKNEDNYRLIMKLKALNKKLEYNPVYPIINHYNEDDYHQIVNLSNTDSRFLKYLQHKIFQTTEEDAEETENIITGLLKRLPNSLSDPGDNPISYHNLYSVHYRCLVKHIGSLDDTSKRVSSKSFDQIFSEYIKIYMNDITNISSFLSESDYITKDQKQRFEKIFTNSKIKFNTQNITQIIELFIKSDIVYEDVLNYVRNIQHIFVNINHDNIPRNGTHMNINLPKEWKLSDSVSSNYVNYSERNMNDEKIKTNLLLHNHTFTRPRNDNYLGFNSYRTLSKNSHIYIMNLYNYVFDDFEDLELIKGDKNGLMNENLSAIFSKHHLLKIFSKMVDYINGLKLEKTDIINDATELYKLLEERTEDLLEENIHICSLFIMDLITHILLSHYDLNWLFMNKSKNKLVERLSRQKEREKQERIEKIHNADRGDRLLMKYQQENGQSNWWKEASEGAQKFVNSEEYSTLSETERIERLQELFTDTNVSFDEVDVNQLNIPQIVPEGTEENLEEEDYYGNQLNEENEEFLDDYDEDQEMVYNE